MIVSMTVCVSHAHASIDTDTEISISIDNDNSEDTSQGGSGCDMPCGGCCVHHAIDTFSKNSDLASVGKGKLLMPDTTLLVSDFIYGLKRPPKA